MPSTHIVKAPTDESWELKEGLEEEDLGIIEKRKDHLVSVPIGATEYIGPCNTALPSRHRHARTSIRSHSKKSRIGCGCYSAHHGGEWLRYMKMLRREMSTFVYLRRFA